VNPSPEQILQAIKNHQRPAQTAAARIRQAFAHSGDSDHPFWFYSIT